MKKSDRYLLIAAAAVILAAAALLLLRPAPVRNDGSDLLRNGAFVPNSEGFPDGWYTDEWLHQAGSTEYDVVQEDGVTAAHIKNIRANDARFVQEVAVSPDTLYCLRGYIKADAQGGRGANLSVADLFVFTDAVYDTAGEWQEVRLYGRTGEDQHSVTVFVRLGGYSGEATGEAWFRDVTLCAVSEVPAQYPVYSWYAAPAAVAPAPAENTADSRAKTALLRLLLISAAYIVLFAVLCSFCRVRDPLPALRPEKRWAPWLAFGLILGAALALRLLIAAFMTGYDVDVGCFTGWASRMTVKGPADFYLKDTPDQTYVCDYPPGYLWILGLMGLIGRWLGTGVTEFMIKLPPILADLGLCALLFCVSRKRVGPLPALMLTAAYAFNPLLLWTGAAWGQADALMVLTLFMTVLWAIDGKWALALPMYVLSILIKPQSLMFGPLGLAVLTVYLIRSYKTKTQRQAWIQTGIGLGAMAVLAALIVLPFSPKQPWDWLLTLYRSTMNEYGYVTVNACNLFFLLGKNWMSAADNVQPGLPVLLGVFLVAVLPLLLVWGLKGDHTLKSRPARLRFFVTAGLVCALALSLAALSLMHRLNYAMLGTVMIVYCVSLCCAWLVLSGQMENLPVYGAILLLMLFNTATMMHERYLVTAVVLLLLGWVLKKDARLLWLALGITVAGFLNVGCVLDRNNRIGGYDGHLDAPNGVIPIHSDMTVPEYLSAALNSALCAASVAFGALLCRNEERKPLKMQKASAFPSPSPKPFSLRNAAVMLGITALYAVLAFVNLGSAKAPQTGWACQEPGETVVFDLGQERTFQVLYYAGIQNNSSYWDQVRQENVEIPGSFTVEVGNDGQAWNMYMTSQVYNGDCFKWKYLSDTPLTGRYVRLIADNYDLSLFELLFRDPETKEGFSAVSVTDSLGNEAAACLNDETGTLEGEPGWYNSTYFDEIYHARTAYEHLHGIYPYETTHPPLGKVIISWFVAIFGMTPFGWRFAGALAGVLMLPGMYLLGRLLTRRSWGGLAAMALMALDLMHFTQTRIATIDSFVVLFIIWMTYFMLRWFFLDDPQLPLWKTLLPLGLSGLMMGLGIASKWTGCYAGAGLAIIFFFGVFRRARLIREAKRCPEKKRTPAQAAAANDGVRRLLLTVASCFLFFIAVPAGIYYLSYIPYFAPSGGVTVQKIIQAAEGMFAYHSESGRGTEHWFNSPWYQWPIIGKPMWYAGDTWEPAGYQSSIMAMGNPAVWWTGLIALVCVLCVWVRRHLRSDRTFDLRAREDDPRWALLLICFAAQYLPWILVPRGTYIYHYFPSVPFIILCTALCLDRLSEKHSRTALGLLIALLCAAAALFIAFFPYASGVAVPQKWLDTMAWFSNPETGYKWLWY